MFQNLALDALADRVIGQIGVGPSGQPVEVEPAVMRHGRQQLAQRRARLDAAPESLRGDCDE